MIHNHKTDKINYLNLFQKDLDEPVSSEKFQNQTNKVLSSAKVWMESRFF